MYDYLTKEQLVSLAETARGVALDLAIGIYKYVAGDITRDELQALVPALIAPQLEQRLYHRIIKKDDWGATWDNCLDATTLKTDELDDEPLNIIEED